MRPNLVHQEPAHLPAATADTRTATVLTATDVRQTSIPTPATVARVATAVPMITVAPPAQPEPASPLVMQDGQTVMEIQPTAVKRL